jgi:hypothetical protein
MVITMQFVKIVAAASHRNAHIIPPMMNLRPQHGRRAETKTKKI